MSGKVSKYDEAAATLAKAIDIALDAFKLYPPAGWNEKQLAVLNDGYIRLKNMAMNPDPGFRTLASLKYLVNDALGYFQEAQGPDVKYFWQKIKQQELPYQRKDMLGTILKRKKLKNDIEYDFVIDNIVVYQQQGILNNTQVEELNKMIADFEAKHSNN